MSAAADRPRRGALPVGMRALLGLGFLLAIAATVLVVFSEQVRWLRFAVLLGLWAALIAAFAVARSRRDARSADQRAEDSKRTYELELHREISARREFEIGVIESAREQAETRHRDELAGLREQLDRLNTTLSGLLDGDLLFERLTLSAESTRVRPVGDSGRGRLSSLAHSGLIQGAAESIGPYVGHESGAPSLPDAPDGPAPVAEPVAEPVEGPVAEPAPSAPISSAEHHTLGTGHSSGISVAEMIAAYGSGQAAPRRRRRAED